MKDEELLALLRSSPQRGLEAVIRQYTPYVMKIARVRLESVCGFRDIEEAVSDIFLKFFNAGQKNGFEFESVRGCLSIIAGRHCVDIFRRESKRPETLPLDDMTEYAALPESQPDERHSAVARAVDSLGEPDRTIFMRKYFYGQKTADIARDLEMKENTVYKHIERGLSKLRKILEKGERNVG